MKRKAWGQTRPPTYGQNPTTKDFTMEATLNKLREVSSVSRFERTEETPNHTRPACLSLHASKQKGPAGVQREGRLSRGARPPGRGSALDIGTTRASASLPTTMKQTGKLWKASATQGQSVCSL